MSNTRRGLPLTSSRMEKIFPVLTPAQINRVEAYGQIRAVQSGELLVEQDYITPRLTVKMARRYWAVDYIDTIALINRIYDCYAST